MHRIAVLLLFVPTLAAEEPLPTAHTVRDIEGWTVHVDDRLLKKDDPVGEAALRILANRLYDIKLVVPADKVARLQKVPIWLDQDYGSLKPAQYHPGVSWLKEHGYSPDLVKCVHIPCAAEFIAPSHQNIQPWSVLHELAHSYHDQVLGFDDPKIRMAYERFKTGGKYKKTLHMSGRMIEHYALTNPMEFFAEMTETYFGVNDFFPFTRAELKHEEPEIYELMENTWGKVRLERPAKAKK